VRGQQPSRLDDLQNISDRQGILQVPMNEHEMSLPVSHGEPVKLGGVQKD
jgi:hypothetical protein